MLAMRITSELLETTSDCAKCVYSCNWIGGQAVADEINAPGYDCAGYTNISTSDNIVHGQVKQAGKFSFSRIYESGHEVPFYQPVVALEMFERAINGKDIATGKVNPHDNYKTEGPKASTYREGNLTIQFDVLPSNSTYNTTSGLPNLRKRGGAGLLSHLGKSFKP